MTAARALTNRPRGSETYVTCTFSELGARWFAYLEVAAVHTTFKLVIFTLKAHQIQFLLGRSQAAPVADPEIKKGGGRKQQYQPRCISSQMRILNCTRFIRE